jgi:hypothetical protein
VASPDDHSHRGDMMQFTRRVWQLVFPFSGTLELPSVRPTGAHSAELAASSCETREHRRTRRENTLSPLPPITAACVRWVMAKEMRSCTAYQQPRPCFRRELVYAKSSCWCWIASRSRKLSARSCAEGCYCASALSGCGCLPSRHSVQSVLPGARTIDFEFLRAGTACRHHAPCSAAFLRTEAAALGQPSC